MTQDTSEIRFSFGKNWQNFLDTVTEEKIVLAENSLRRMLDVQNLKGMRFLDAGCGSGLFSLAAYRLGAEKVVSFDFDLNSVACTRSLQERAGTPQNWIILTGSVLDSGFLQDLGKFEVVYSWGVLHHTGKMWEALDKITSPSTESGYLYISIYNDQKFISKLWKQVKWFYNISPQPVKWLMASCYCLVYLIIRTISGLIHRKPPSRWYQYANERGMSLWHDVVDWMGGYPFETASTKEITDFYQKRHFRLINSREKTGSGCNEFVFVKTLKTSEDEKSS